MSFGALLGQTASGGGGKRVCRFTVGTSTAGWTANDCDYLCDGTADDVEINAAIQALPAEGGEIVILDGTYNITATIAMNKDNVTLSGNGSSTVLKRMWNSNRYTGIIDVTATNGGCCVEKLQLDGNRANYSSSNNVVLYLDSSNNNIIKDNIFINGISTGVWMHGGDYNIIKNNVLENNSRGLNLRYGDNNSIIGNVCNNISYNIITRDLKNNTITGNTCINGNTNLYLDAFNSTICNNTFNNGGIGIYLWDSDNNTITGNVCNNNSRDGIYLDISNNNTITGNTCIRGTGQPSDYATTQNTIRVSSGSSNNLCVGNNIMGKNYVDNGTNNTWANNKYN